MIIISDYDTWRDAKGRIHILSKEKIGCPICTNALKVRDSKERKVILPGDKEKTRLVIRRLICDKCHKLHSELPDMVVPYKRHGRETVEAIVNGDEPPL
jgi:transposase